MKRVRKVLFFVFLLLASGSALSFLMIKMVPDPPVDEIEYAREALSLAGKNKADSYSRKLYREAKSAYDSAMVRWKRENKRFIYFRDYEKVKEYAELTVRKAGEASENSIYVTLNLKTTLKNKIDNLYGLINILDSLFTRYPLTSVTRNRISKGKFLLKETEIAWEKGQFLQADRKMTEAEYLLTTSNEDAFENLQNYFKSYPEWKKWVDRAIAESKEKQDYSIVVDKFSRKVYIYHNGRKKHEYSAELGLNWAGNKRERGDKATPEGRYVITKKFGTNKTKYYKALLISYPNEDDKARFNAEIAGGTLPGTAKIGGMIEIHGSGGKGVDWTDGCIALTDKEMDVVYSLAKIGTPVTIVGSMYDLDHVLNR